MSGNVNPKTAGGLRSLFDKMKPTFSDGGRLAWLGITFEAFESFAFSSDTVTQRGCHIRDAVDMKRSMITVVIALLPALLFGMWNTGYQRAVATGSAADLWSCLGFGFVRIMPLIFVSYAVGLAIEFAFAQVRHHQVNEGFLITGLLIPMIVPATTPLWQLALAVAFAVIIGKEAFGGTGMNFINPALLARAFLFFAYPSHMSGDKIWIAAKYWGTDAIAGATPLGEMAAGAGRPTALLTDLIIGTTAGSSSETSAIAIAVGAVILLATGIASWRIIVAVIGGGCLMGILFNTVGLNEYMQLPFYYHLFMGGFLFGAVFMATDPVTSAQTNIGKWIYGLLIGLFAVLLRVVNPAYPEGMMLSILLMNCLAPLIDHCVVQANIRRRLKRAQS